MYTPSCGKELNYLIKYRYINTRFENYTDLYKGVDRFLSANYDR